jgi:3-hydroxybutyrate dehydrogenase
MLKGKTALVTGSTSGIGLGIARHFAAQGAQLMINGFGDVDGALKELRDTGARVVYHGADMSQPAQIADMLRACEAEFGACDVLVNNAGIQHLARIEDFPVERWDAIIAINLSSAFHTMRAALPGMKARGWGRILNIASLQSVRAFADSAPYGAGKGGIVQLTRAMAQAWSPHGITCNAIGPGFFPTDLTAPVFADPADWIKVPFTVSEVVRPNRTGTGNAGRHLGVKLVQEDPSLVRILAGATPVAEWSQPFSVELTIRTGEPAEGEPCLDQQLNAGMAALIKAVLNDPQRTETGPPAVKLAINTELGGVAYPEPGQNSESIVVLFDVQYRCRKNDPTVLA